MGSIGIDRNGTGTKKTRIGHLKLSEAHRVSLGGLAKLTMDLVAAPALTAEGFVLTIRPDSPTASQVSLSTMPTSWGTHAPTIQAH